MNNPNNALWLYLAIWVVAFLFSPRWGAFYRAVADATNAKRMANG